MRSFIFLISVLISFYTYSLSDKDTEAQAPVGMCPNCEDLYEVQVDRFEDTNPPAFVLREENNFRVKKSSSSSPDAGTR